MNWELLAAIVIGIVALGLVWKVVKGIIRLAVSLAVVVLVIYVVANYL